MVSNNVISASVIAKCDSRTWRIETARKNAASSPVVVLAMRRAILKRTTRVRVPAPATKARATTTWSANVNPGSTLSARRIADAAALSAAKT